MRCAVIGLGEVGSRYATAIADAGNEVVGFDPVVTGEIAGCARVDSVEAAVAGADMVLVTTSASAAPAVASTAIEALGRGSVYADLTSAAPGVMRELGEQVNAAGGRFVDVAILGPVSVHGAKTPVMIAGADTDAAAALFEALGAETEVLPDSRPGDAMAHKLLRSVFMKGVAVVICEAMDAAEAAGLADWTRDQIARQLAGDGNAVIDRFRTGSRVHAARRAQEMRDTSAYLADLNVPHTMSAAAAQYLADLQTAGEVSPQR